jgi:hypothetical protein
MTCIVKATAVRYSDAETPDSATPRMLQRRVGRQAMITGPVWECAISLQADHGPATPERGGVLEPTAPRA